MDLNDYQDKALKTAFYPNIGDNLVYPTLGLGEAGEIQGIVKKIFRDNSGILTPEVREKLIKELGDLLWYISCCAFEIGTSLNDIAERNIEKLAGRALRGTLSGSGDER